MNYYLVAAALLAFLLGAAHSVLGEKTLLGPLFAGGHLPKLLGSAEFAKQTLRFTWHVTTVALWGLAGILWLLASGAPGGIADVMALTFAVCAAVALVGTRGRHFSWAVFAATAVLVWLGR